MPGMTGATVVALEHIELLPRNQQELAQKIYYEFESIQLIGWSKCMLIVIVLTLTVFFGKTFLMLESVYANIILAATLSVLTHKFINNKFLMSWQRRIAQRIIQMTTSEVWAGEVLEHLKNMPPTILGPSVKNICQKFQI